MQIKKTIFNKILFLLIIVPVISILAILLVVNQGSPTFTQAQIQDGKQVIEVYAKNGFNPSVIEAKAGIETILKMRTFNTYDCTGFLNMPKANINNQELPPTGTTEFTISAQNSGEVFRGSCSTGANILEIRFN